MISRILTGLRASMTRLKYALEIKQIVQYPGYRSFHGGSWVITPATRKYTSFPNISEKGGCQDMVISCILPGLQPSMTRLNMLLKYSELYNTQAIDHFRPCNRAPPGGHLFASSTRPCYKNCWVFSQTLSGQAWTQTSKYYSWQNIFSPWITWNKKKKTPKC